MSTNDRPRRVVPCDTLTPEQMTAREWLVTNGLGGFASGTLTGVMTRRHHGLLVASLPAPLGRTVMLNHLAERVRLPTGEDVDLGGQERVGGETELHAARHLEEFTLELGLPVWRYEIEGRTIEKRVVLPYLQNTSYISYRLIDGDGPIRLQLRPSVHFRSHEAPVDLPLDAPYVLTAWDGRYELRGPDAFPPLRMRFDASAATFTVDARPVEEILYRLEELRGYEAVGALWSPGYFEAELEAGSEVVLVASTEPWKEMDALSPLEARSSEEERRDQLLSLAPPPARSGAPAELVLAADQFIITPAGRGGEAARAHAVGGDVRTVIAGYHWFTDWGRDTMISLEGLALSTGRLREAGTILRTFAHYVRDGLIPNMFPDGSNEGLYHTADATLWFFHTLDRYVQASGDRTTLRELLPTLRDIARHHLSGTRFGIGVDPEDGLLHQGEEGYQLTWMDAKVDDWVVTPRRGKAVELNALWYNALELLGGWLLEEGDEQDAETVAGHAERCRRSFNERFWYPEGGYLYDIVDGEEGDDSAFRPNQIFAISLRHPILERDRWEPVVDAVRDRLLTPMGLRSLERGHPDYKPNYHGDLRTRDAAYHQGTVWSWLIGPFVDAWLRVHPEDRERVRRDLDGLVAHLDEFGVGSVAEVADAEPPFSPRGCIAQAWGVSELLRCLLRTADGEA